MNTVSEQDSKTVDQYLVHMGGKNGSRIYLDQLSTKKYIDTGFRPGTPARQINICLIKLPCQAQSAKWSLIGTCSHDNQLL